MARPELGCFAHTCAGLLRTALDRPDLYWFVHTCAGVLTPALVRGDRHWFPRVCVGSPTPSAVAYHPQEIGHGFNGFNGLLTRHLPQAFSGPDRYNSERHIVDR